MLWNDLNTHETFSFLELSSIVMGFSLSFLLSLMVASLSMKMTDSFFLRLLMVYVAVFSVSL
jgi:hypothetical protein